MSVIASITTSVDGYVTGPNDGPGCGLGVGGERLHYWVMGGPWTYETEHDVGGMEGVDREFFDELTANLGSGICGRGMYEAAGAWGGTNPFGGTMFVLTHRTADPPVRRVGRVAPVRDGDRSGDDNAVVGLPHRFTRTAGCCRVRHRS